MYEDPNAVVETVKIQSGDGFAVINKTDFDEKVHKIFIEPKSEPKTETKTPAK